MNILVLTPLVPYPPHDGDKLRLYHFLKYLKSKGHQIDLFCLTRVKDDMRYADDLKTLCRSVHVEHLPNFDLFFNLVGGLLIGMSFNLMSYFSPKFRDHLYEYAKSPNGKKVDVVLCHRLRMIMYPFKMDLEPNRTNIRKLRVGGSVFAKPVVLDLTDSLTSYAAQLKKQPGAPWLRRLAAMWDNWFLKVEEVQAGHRVDKAVIISEQDARVLTAYGLPADKIAVIPNGVDLSGIKRKNLKSVYPTKRPVVCFIGNMGYAPNEEGALWFIKNIWPKIKAEVPNALFAAVGGSPRWVLKKYDNGKDIFVTGWVPEVEPYLLNAQVSIAPLRFAGGMQNKVALSLGLGIPVVATSAATGWLPEAGKKSVRIANDRNPFADEVVDILKNPRKAKALALKEKKFIAKNYQWKAEGKKLEAVLKQASRRK